jgi:hypothetical protein
MSPISLGGVVEAREAEGDEGEMRRGKVREDEGRFGGQVGGSSRRPLTSRAR